MVQHNWQESDPVELKQHKNKKFRKNFKSIDRKKTLVIKSRNTVPSISCPAFKKKKLQGQKHIKEAGQASQPDMTGVVGIIRLAI